MIKIFGTKLPRYLHVAVSGGVDSMAALSFLSRNHRVTATFFHHGTENSERALEFVKSYIPEKFGVDVLIGFNKRDKTPKESYEEFWRNQRYEFFESLNATVVTAHNLDDCVETWIWSSLHGTPKLIPKQRNNIIRPLLTTSKQTLKDWCVSKDVKWIEDSSNQDSKFTRNFIRNEMMENVLRVNPGISKMIKKKLMESLKQDNSYESTNRRSD